MLWRLAMMFRAIPRVSGVFLSASLLAGCVGSSDRYPSLATRDAERAAGTFQPVNPVAATPAPASTATLSRVEQLLEDARLAHTEFLDATPSARTDVEAAIATGPEDNAWSIAQVSLADLDSHRSLAAIALSDLDLLYADATLEFSDREQIDDARSHVAAILSEEDATLDELRGLLGS